MNEEMDVELNWRSLTPRKPSPEIRSKLFSKPKGIGFGWFEDHSLNLRSLWPKTAAIAFATFALFVGTRGLISLSGEDFHGNYPAMQLSSMEPSSRSSFCSSVNSFKFNYSAVADATNTLVQMTNGRVSSQGLTNHSGNIRLPL